MAQNTMTLCSLRNLIGPSLQQCCVVDSNEFNHHMPDKHPLSKFVVGTHQMDNYIGFDTMSDVMLNILHFI